MTKIAFQCKRYSGPVSSREVQGFQGAVGDAEKGIFFTTGYFTDSARDAARHPACKPIELFRLALRPEALAPIMGDSVVVRLRVAAKSGNCAKIHHEQRVTLCISSAEALAVT